MAHDVCRETIKDHLAHPLPSANAGLLLRRGMTRYDSGNATGDAGKGGSEKQQLLERIAKLEPTPLYRAAFRRWQEATADGMRFTRFEAALASRLYIGVNRDSALETGLSVQHAYGMPLIPGTALKGLARSVARKRLTARPDAITWLFGADADADEAEVGGIIFHDALWVPKGKPFVPEVITPHHPEYYNLGKGPATDFDSPIPAPQLAVQGSFLFVLEGDPTWCEIARSLLQFGLQEIGIGGKTRAGYGFFSITPGN